MAEQVVPLDQIWADAEFNSRGDFSPASVASLADDIERDGLIQAIVVQPLVNEKLGTKFKIVVGHRRYTAHKLLARRDPVKWGGIRASVLPEVLTEEAALLMNIQENLVREPLNMVQEAKAISRFKKFHWTSKEIANALGQSKKWVENRLGLLTLPQVIQDRAASGLLTQYQIEEVLSLADADDQYAYVREIVDKRDKVEHLTGFEVKKASVRKDRSKISIAADGAARSPAEMFLVQESIQDSFDDWQHPAAVALAWASGNLPYADFVHHITRWAAEAGIEFKQHPEILKRVG